MSVPRGAADSPAERAESTCTALPAESSTALTKPACNSCSGFSPVEDGVDGEKPEITQMAALNPSSMISDKLTDCETKMSEMTALNPSSVISDKLTDCETKMSEKTALNPSRMISDKLTDCETKMSEMTALNTSSVISDKLTNCETKMSEMTAVMEEVEPLTPEERRARLAERITLLLSRTSISSDPTVAMLMGPSEINSTGQCVSSVTVEKFLTHPSVAPLECSVEDCLDVAESLNLNSLLIDRETRTLSTIMKRQRTTLTIRNIPEPAAEPDSDDKQTHSTSSLLDDLRRFILSAPCFMDPVTKEVDESAIVHISCEGPVGHKVWFVTLKSEELTVEAALYLRTQQFKGAVLSVGIKTESAYQTVLERQSVPAAPSAAAHYRQGAMLATSRTEASAFSIGMSGDGVSTVFIRNNYRQMENGPVDVKNAKRENGKLLGRKVKHVESRPGKPHGGSGQTDTEKDRRKTPSAETERRLTSGGKRNKRTGQPGNARQVDRKSGNGAGGEQRTGTTARKMLNKEADFPPLGGSSITVGYQNKPFLKYTPEALRAIERSMEERHELEQNLAEKPAQFFFESDSTVGDPEAATVAMSE